MYVEDPVCGNGINPIVEYSANGSILARYVYAGGLHIAKIAGADTHFYHCDALGSVRVMTDENAVIKWQARYWPFGEMTKWGFGDNTHGFTPLEISPLMYRGEDFVFVLRFLTGQAGKEWDSEMGLNYPVFSLILKDNKGNEDPALRDFCQRYYDPEIGRFTTLDPQDSPASSPYAYCANNPLKFIDPTGEAFSYIEMEEMAWALREHAAWKEGMPSNQGFGSWPGSMASWMRANPGFEGMVRFSEWQSGWRFFFAKNDYFRTTTTIGNERITTEYFFNSITSGIGMITTTATLGWEVALNCAQAYNVICDAAFNWGAPTVLRSDKYTRNFENWSSGHLPTGLIEDPIFWAVVGYGLHGKISSTIGVNIGFHSAHHSFFGAKMRHIQFDIYLRHISGSRIPIRIPWPW